ncbi:unnamed protein product [Aureobasidium uvarum]|uniref:Membrane insertase YidC/Oxa/ALB C-terminal domain-containing protein n=1 Tax=Aureobasidium uvarum TaxID=2773716 RepID=A0A9N8KKT5_9PEZI|nr:unnamed protein product [Aureobasidium uvarum]
MSTPSRPLAALNSRSTSRILQGSVISLPAHARLASTSAPAAAPAATIAPPPTPATDALATDSNPFDISDATDYANLPERLGFLKDLGLDYGWGPTSVIEWSLEHVHVLSGMPWWGSIAATAFLYRLALVPMFMKASENGAKMRAMQPITKPMNDKMMDAMRNGDRVTAMQMRQEMMAINKAAGVSTIGMLVPSVVQGVFGFCAFRLLRAMSNLPVPGLETGGFLWIADLTQTDPYFLLPAIMGGTLHMVMRMGGETGTPMTASMRPFLLYVFPGIVFITTAWLPAALNVWLCTTGIMGVAQVHLFKRADIRRMFGLTPMVDAEQAHRDAVAAGLVKEEPKTIDVKAKSYPADQRPIYQAPNVKFSTSSAPARKTASSTASADAVLQAPQSPFDSVKEKGFGLFNNAGKSWDAMKQSMNDQVVRMRGASGKPKSKTRSTEFMKSAEDYERRWQKYNKK